MKITSWTYLVVFAIGILCCWWFMRGCDKPDAGLIDSIKILSAKNDTIVLQNDALSKKNDSVILAKRRGDSLYSHKIDSQSRIIAIWEGRFKITKDSIGVLYDKLKELYVAHDTADLVEAYQQLGEQLQDAKTQLSALRVAKDSADNIREAEITRLQGVINQLQTEIIELKTLLVQCTSNASELAKTGLKAAKKAKIAGLISKLGVGLSALLAVLLLSHK